MIHRAYYVKQGALPDDCEIRGWILRLQTCVAALIAEEEYDQATAGYELSPEECQEAYERRKPYWKAMSALKELVPDEPGEKRELPNIPNDGLPF